MRAKTTRFLTIRRAYTVIKGVSPPKKGGNIMQTVPFLALQRHFSRLGPDIALWLRDQYGSRTQVNVPLLGRAVYLFAPDDLHDMLVRRHDQFIKPRLLNRLTTASFGQGLFTSDGEAWRKRRKLMQPHFHHVHIRRYADRMVAHAAKMSDSWHNGETRPLDADMHALTFRILLDTLFSSDADAHQTDHIADAMHDLGAGLTAATRNPLYAALPTWFPLPALRRRRRGEQALTRLVGEAISQRRAMGEDSAPHDVLSLLVFSRDEETGALLDDRAIHDELVTLYIAGHETTALTLGWAFVALAQQPHAEAALHAELDSVLGGALPTAESLAQLPYTQAVIKEVLRLYPPAWFIAREPVADVMLDGGDVLPKGALVLGVSYGTHRDPTHYPDPLAFRPERWLGDLEKSLPKGAYLPFGLGPRTCIGNGFALMESQLTLATLAQRWRLSLVDTPRHAVGTLTLAFGAPVRVRVGRR